MGVITGLAAIKEEMAKKPQGGGNYEDRPKATWVTLKDGESLKLIFLNEIDEGSPNYSEKNGLAALSIQHTNPENWRKTAACTADEGDCYGCANNWKQKHVLYFNVLVDDGKNDPYVGIWSRGLGKGSVAQGLVDMAADEDYNFSITDKVFKFNRTGSTKDDTTYTLSPLPKPHDKDLESYELFDLPQYIFTVSPDRQEAYYTDGQASAPAERSKPAVSASDINAQW